MIEVRIPFSLLRICKLIITIKQQSLYRAMLEIALTFPDADEQVKAAEQFRLPYWDYYRPRDWNGPRQGLPNFYAPQVFTLEEVMVQLPGSDKLELIKNPLHHYEFPTEAIPSSQWSITGASVSAVLIVTCRFPHMLIHGIGKSMEH